MIDVCVNIMTNDGLHNKKRTTCEQVVLRVKESESIGRVVKRIQDAYATTPKAIQERDEGGFDCYSLGVIVR